MSRRTTLLALALLLGAGAFWWWYSTNHPAGWSPALSSREIATRVLAEELTRRYPGAKALVLGNPFAERSGQSAEIYAFEKTSIRGLQQGFGSPEAIKVVHPELRPEFLQRPESVFIDPKTTTPISFLMAENAFDQLADAHPGFDLWISLIGVPTRIRESKVWRESTKPALALLLPDWRLVGPASAIREAFHSGKLAAAVLNRPGTAGNEPIDSRSNYREEFERRFLLATKDNIDEMVQTYPHLF